MQIRIATPEDIPAIVRIEQQSETAAHWTPEAYDKLFDKNAPLRHVLVADDGQQIPGFIVARGISDEWEIENVAVLADSRKRGIGSRLVQQLLRDLRTAGARAVLLEVRESNLAARGLYEKAGFRVQGKRRDYYRNPTEDALLLQCVTVM